MPILIAVASRHGSTREMAETIAHELRTEGYVVDLRNIEDSPGIAGYDAAIIGSAIYMGTWLKEGRDFIEHHQAELAEIPVWLWSSGPLGTGDEQPPNDESSLRALVALAGARDHQIFAGKLDSHKLGFGERVITKVVDAPEGDFRDWNAIRAWTREIASALLAANAASG